jgi:hypothetical protein
MAELADAQASGACGSNIVRVQVPLPAFFLCPECDGEGKKNSIRKGKNAGEATGAAPAFLLAKTAKKRRRKKKYLTGEFIENGSCLWYDKAMTASVPPPAADERQGKDTDRT